MNQRINFFGGYYRPFDEDLDTIIVGIDPGVTTGLSVVAFSSKSIPTPQTVEHWGSDQISYGGSGNVEDLIDDGVDDAFVEQRISLKIAEAITALSKFSGNETKTRRVIVAIENFTVRQLNSSAEFLAPVRLAAGITQELFHTDNTKIYFQTPADAKGICTDKRMDKWGYEIKTQKDRHSRDADRHAILCLRRILENPRRMEASSFL
ncbi:MAG: hypothetical protein PHW63_10570 [Alphaproteobacteria bacterium]|nr:hypothetical protein [Alphaproteobacteria bacterium]